MVRADVADALAILDHLDAAHARRSARLRLALIQVGRSAGMGPTALQDPLRQRFPQGVVDLEKRLRAMLDPHIGVPSAKAAREHRAATEAAETVARVAAGTLHEFATDLVRLDRRQLLPPNLGEACTFDADDLHRLLAADLRRSGGPSSGFVAMLRLIVRWLDRQPGLNTELRALLTRNAQLVEQLGGRLT